MKNGINTRFCKAAALLLVLLIVSACGDSAGPSASGNANLKAIGVAESDLETPVAADVTEYESYVPGGVEVVSVIAETADPGATVNYGGLDPKSIPIGDGDNKVSITVTSGDGNVTKIYTLHVIRCASTATMTVLDSVNGSLLPAAGIEYRVLKSGVLVGYLKANGNPQAVSLPPGVPFRVEASAPERASSALEDVVAKPGDNPWYFVCQIREMSTFPAASPGIKTVQKTTAADPVTAPESGWTDMAVDSDLDLSTVTGFRVKADGYSVMDPTSWSGTGVMLAFDAEPARFFGYLPAASTTNTYDATGGIFHAVAIFDYAGMQLLPGAHALNVVVYDRANNRVGRSLAVNVVSSPAAGADIRACLFADLTADMRVYGVSQGFFGPERGPSIAAPQPLPTGGTSFYVRLIFRFTDAAAANQPILGFVVKRSNDGGATFADAGSVHYGALSTGTAGTHEYFDVSPALEIGVAYTYKVETFTDAAHRKESGTITGTLLRPFTASLVAPAHGSKSVEFDNIGGTGPEYTFSISDPSLWDAAVADSFHFAPILQEKSGTIDFYGEFRYILATDSLQFKRGGDWVDVVQNFGGRLSDYIVYSNGLVTCKALLFTLGPTNMYNGSPLAYASGVTYEWDIFGAHTPGGGNLGDPHAMVSSHFTKSSGGTVCASYADIYHNGAQTLNGRFEFTAK